MVKKKETQTGTAIPHPSSRATSDNPEQRRIRRQNRGEGSVADWRSVDADLLSRAIAAVASHGFAIRFGYTRDFGAYAIGILGDGEPFTEYIRPTEDIDVYIAGLASDYEN